MKLQSVYTYKSADRKIDHQPEEVDVLGSLEEASNKALEVQDEFKN